jgi:hypothetical protein
VLAGASEATAPHEAAGATIAIWCSAKDGTPANGGSGTKAAPGLREKIAGPLKICTKNALHATMRPEKWKGDRFWIVALYGEIQRQDDKLGALERVIICEAK